MRKGSAEMEKSENLEVFLMDPSELRGIGKSYCSQVTAEEYRKEAVEYTRQELGKLEKLEQFQKYLQSKEPRFLFISMRVLILLTSIAFVISFFTYLRNVNRKGEGTILTTNGTNFVEDAMTVLNATSNATNVQNDIGKITELLKPTIETLQQTGTEGNELEKQPLNAQMRTLLNSLRSKASKPCPELEWSEKLAKVGQEALEKGNQDLSSYILKILNKNGDKEINNVVLTFDFDKKTGPLHILEEHRLEIISPQYRACGITHTCKENICTVAVILSSVGTK